MGQGRTTSLTLRLTPAERRTLLAWQRSTTTISAGRARRGRIIFLVADGVPIAHVATTVGINRRFVYKWVRRVFGKSNPGIGRKTRPGPLRPVPPASPGGQP